MQHVISAKQAREITGGRLPHMPVHYENAVRELSLCISLDDAKEWSDKADALAAWAKIYHSDEADRKAKQLKLHAFRRMGEIAGELRPMIRKGIIRGTGGPVSLLRDNGLSRHKAVTARTLSLMSKGSFEGLLNSDTVPSPNCVKLTNHYKNHSKSWVKIMSGTATSLATFRVTCRGNNAKEIAHGFNNDEVKGVKDAIVEVMEWLDKLDQFLPRTFDSK
jgi:hypothetical protein